MAPFSGPVLVDTNVILECHRKGCWKPLASRYQLETVEPCIVETQTGYQRRRPEFRIEEAALRKSLHAVHRVSTVELAQVVLMGGAGLDEGEQALWAHAISRQDAWILCGPDRASMRFGFQADLRERIVSLGGLFADIGFRPQKALSAHFEKQWLEDVMRQLVLGNL